MSKIKVPNDLSNIKDQKDFQRFCSVLLSSVVELINGKLLPQDNFDTSLLTCTFSATNTNTSFDHGLNRVPEGYILYGSSAAMNIYDGSSANDSKKIYLRSSATGIARILVF